MNLAQPMGGKGGNLVFLRASSGPRLGPPGSGGRYCGERSCGKGHRRGRCRDHRDEERGAWGDGERDGGGRGRHGVRSVMRPEAESHGSGAGSPQGSPSQAWTWLSLQMT